MTNDPDQIKADIEVTRADLSRNVDALAETVRPANVVQRQKDKVTTKVFGAKDSVMGAPPPRRSPPPGTPCTPRVTPSRRRRTRHASRRRATRSPRA